MTELIAHELAHLWFGDLVTCDWWSHFWMNEGFASYFQYFGLAEVGFHFHFITFSDFDFLTEDDIS